MIDRDVDRNKFGIVIPSDFRGASPRGFYQFPTQNKIRRLRRCTQIFFYLSKLASACIRVIAFPICVRQYFLANASAATIKPP